MAEDLLPEWATAKANGWQVGAQLCTKDGRRCGNAVIAGCVISVIRRQPVWIVFTDAGSELMLSEKELHELFYFPEWLMRVETAPGFQKWQRKKLGR